MQAPTSAFDRCCRKSRGSKDTENLAKVVFSALLQRQGTLEPIRRPVVVFVSIDVGPQSPRAKRISGFRQFRLVPLKDFFDSIDPERKSAHAYVHPSGLTRQFERPPAAMQQSGEAAPLLPSG